MILWGVTNTFDSLPSDLAAPHALILAERAARRQSEACPPRAEADLTYAQATASSADALIARLELEIEKLRRTLDDARSEPKERLADQLEMQLEDAEADATKDELAAGRSTPSTVVKSLERRRSARKRFPQHLTRERVVMLRFNEAVEARRRRDRDARGRPASVEGDPAVRERFFCRQCEAITQRPAPFHGTPRGFAGASHFHRPSRHCTGRWLMRNGAHHAIA
jgi:hypothetical protein